jgi:hypothetical protein
MFREPIDVLVVDLLFEVEFYGLIIISNLLTSVTMDMRFK